MKRIIIAAVFVLSLTACHSDFSQNKQPEQIAPKVYSFNFVIKRGVTDQQKDAFLEVINKRIKNFGTEIEEIELTENKNISVKISPKLGVIFLEDKFKQYMLNTPIFELRLEDKAKNLKLTADEGKAIKEYNQKAQKHAQELLTAVLAKPESFAELARENSEDPGSRDKGGAYIGIKKGDFVAAYEDVIFNKLKVGEIYPKLVETPFGYHIIKKDAERGEGDKREIDTSHILISRQTQEQILAARRWLETGLTGLDIQKVDALKQPDGQLLLQIVFNQSGKQLLADLTKKNIGRRIAIFINNKAIGTPTIEKEIKDGQILISSNFSQEQIISVTQTLNSGVIHSGLALGE